MSKYSRTDVAKIISMVCDQFNAGLAGREEFVNKTIDYYDNQPKAADESPPASAVEEAARMYPLEDTAEKGEAGYMFTRNEITDIERSAHITCAGMYTGGIERLKTLIHDAWYDGFGCDPIQLTNAEMQNQWEKFKAKHNL